MCTTYGYLLKHTPVRQMPMTRQQAGTHDTYLPYCPHYATHETCARPRLEGKSTQFCCKWHKRTPGACCLPSDSRPGPSQATMDNRHRLRRGEESTQAKYTNGNPPPWVHAPPAPNQYTNEEAICVLEKCTLRPLPRQYTNVKAICVLEPCTLRPLPRQYTNVKAICVIG